LHALINGVDLTRFQPQPVAAARQRLGLPAGPILLMVGHLVELKGHRLAIDALALLRRTHPEARLVIVGDGPERQRLERQAVECGLVSAMRFVGAVPNSDLAEWYSAADVLVLASSREGSPNVVLEALACGTPVAATRVGGVPEIVDDPAVGSLTDERTAQALSDAIRRTLAAKTDRARIRAHAERFGWQQTTQRQLDLFRSMLRASGSPHCA
jgi:glycosyltransferase involved in cell wall biosynthesis